MKNTERSIVYAVLAVCLVLGLASLNGRIQASATAASVSATDPSADEPAAGESKPVKIAVCDVYGVTEKLVESDRFVPDREAEEKRLREMIEPMRQELTDMQREIDGLDPKDEATQAKIREFRAKREQLAIAEQKAATAFGTFVAGQFLDAFEIARGSVSAVAERNGYTHVLASRDPSKRIETLNPERIVEAFLGRPVIVAPEGTDITLDVLAELHLD